MRKRTPTTPSSPGNSSDDDSLPTTHPNEDDQFFMNHLDTVPSLGNLFFPLLLQLKEGKRLWVQILTIYIAAVLLYGNAHVEGIHANLQITIMTVITMVGASPFSSTHLMTATIGVFAGGHNIIGSSGSMEDGVEVTWVNYVWLFLLSFVIGLFWNLVMTKWKILDGFAGRLGTTVFIGMNLTMFVFAPLGVVGLDRYYYGLVQVLDSEEDSIPLSRAWIEEAELAIAYVVAVVYLGVMGGGTRVMHNSYIKRLEETNEEISPKQLPQALNNVLIPVLWALLSMLIVIVTGYKNAPVMFNGFAVGSYVAMASLQKIPSIRKFAVVSLVAAGWGLFLTPFFVGFPGKSGFAAMLGHTTCYLTEAMRDKVRRKSLTQHQNEAAFSSTNTYPDVESVQHHVQQEAPDSPRIDHRFKPKTEDSVITKHQRRQQRKLKHFHLQNSQQGNEDEADPPKLHHRAWSAVKEEADDGMWHHSLKSSRQEWNTMITISETV